jgi:hypothetical protein
MIVMINYGIPSEDLMSPVCNRSILSRLLGTAVACTAGNHPKQTLKYINTGQARVKRFEKWGIVSVL